MLLLLWRYLYILGQRLLRRDIQFKFFVFWRRLLINLLILFCIGGINTACVFQWFNPNFKRWFFKGVSLLRLHESRMPKHARECLQIWLNGLDASWLVLGLHIRLAWLLVLYLNVNRLRDLNKFVSCALLIIEQMIVLELLKSVVFCLLVNRKWTQLCVQTWIWIQAALWMPVASHGCIQWLGMRESEILLMDQVFLNISGLLTRFDINFEIGLPAEVRLSFISCNSLRKCLKLFLKSLSLIDLTHTANSWSKFSLQWLFYKR